jgi:sugar-specific transcriptional regulator TrmB
MNLRELGLSAYEEQAYMALIKLGKSSASTISRQSGVSYGKIYEILGSLEAKGLVHTLPSKTKLFVATDPEQLMKLVNKKEESLNEIKQNIRDLKQIYTEHEVEPVVIAKGKNNFYKIVKQMKNPERYTYNLKYTFEYHPDFVRGMKRNISRGITVKTLGRFDNETKTNVDKWKKIYPHIKPIENDGIAMSIEDDEELMITMIKSNTIMLIRDKPLVKLMKVLFENYYEKSK